MIRTSSVNPPAMSNERQAELLLEGREAIGKQAGLRNVLVETSAIVGGVSLPGIRRALGIPPTVQLQVTQRETVAGKVIPHRQHRAGIPIRRIVVIVIGSTIVRPITELIQLHRGIIGRAHLAGKPRQRLAPRIIRPVDPTLDGENGPMRETGRQLRNTRLYPTGNG